jgi:hypothetical protein
MGELPHSATEPDLVAALDRFGLNFIAAREGAAAVLELAERRPDCGLAQVYAALLHFYAQSTAQAAAHVRPLLARAAALPLNERERLLAEAVGDAAGGDYTGAAARCEAIAAEWPRDLAAAKFGEFMFYLAPDYARHLRFMAGVAAANPGLSHVEAMHAFALEMAGEYGRAEQVAAAALGHDPDTPWAHHALAHLCLNRGRLDDGRRVLQAAAPSWDAHVRSMQCHNWWHLALFDVAALDLDAAWNVYRQRIWGFVPDDPQEHVDAISLLWRLELAGADAGDAWAPIAAAIAPRAGEAVFPFLSAHYAYALTRAGEHATAAAAQAALRDHASRCSGDAARIWRIGLPLVQGVVAAAAGDHARAATLLEPLLPDMPCAGGSDAQNDLFRQTCLAAWLATGRRAAARAFLAQRIGDRSALPLEQRWLALAG